MLFVACSTESPNKKFGDQNITEEGKVTGQELLNQLSENDSVQVKVEAVINSICQKKGCWMYVDLNEETEMLVRFKDYGFFVPMDAHNHFFYKIFISGCCSFRSNNSSTLRSIF